MKKYLVIAIYADDEQRWADSFDAADPQEAERMAHESVLPNEIIIAGVIDTETITVVA